MKPNWKATAIIVIAILAALAAFYIRSKATTLERAYSVCQEISDTGLAAGILPDPSTGKPVVFFKVDHIRKDQLSEVAIIILKIKDKNMSVMAITDIETLILYPRDEK